MATRQRASGYEVHGIGGSSTYAPAEYFPLLPDHMTRVARSTALIFGVTTGDLAPTSGNQVDRYIQLDLNSSGVVVQPLATFGMHEKNEWTMHIVVSPDPDDSDKRSWETVFDIGDPDYVSGGSNHPIRVTVELDRLAAGTAFRVVTEAQGFSPRIASTTVSDTGVETVNGRRWYQLIVQYYEDHSNYDIERIRLRVNTIDSSTGVVDSVTVAANSNEWRSAVPSTARLGLDLEDANPFHGAMHHLAIWKKLLDTDYDVSTEIDELSDAFATTYATPDPRPAFVIDWNAEPRFFMWDRPLSDTPLPTGDRNIRNWTDPLWDTPFVYPMVRLYASSPNVSGSEYTPADLFDGVATRSWSPETATASGIGRHTANWIEYLNLGLDVYGQDTVATKSLQDTNAVSVVWQNWGTPMKDFNGAGTDFYTDWGSARGLVQNWRDARAEWRDGSGSLTGTIDTNSQFSELLSPFYREGMSQNAFMSKDAFIALRQELDTRGLPTPSRLHFDTERGSNINQAWKVSGGVYTEGWWDRSVSPVTDPRANDPAYWSPPTVTSGGYSTLANLAAGFATATSYDRYARQNNAILSAFARFSKDHYDHAFGVGLLMPAVEELNSTIRMSEYKVVFSGPTGTPQESLGGKVRWAYGNTQPNWFDFSSPVLYPPSTSSLDPKSSFYTDTLFKPWADALGIGSRLVTVSMPNNGADDATTAEVQHDARIVYVERSKHQLNAAYLAGGGWDGAPTAPWLPYPNNNMFYIQNMFDVNGDGIFNDTVLSPQTWQDIARIAAFAYRRGTREFIMWGNLGSNNGDSNNAWHASIAEDLALIFEVIDHIRERPTDMTTTGTVYGDAEYGVPDGRVDWDDLYYFQSMHGAGDLEADFSGPDGYPDGVIDAIDDVNDFGAQWSIDRFN